MNPTLFNPTWININEIHFKVISFIFLLLMLNWALAEDTLPIGLVFERGSELNGVEFALQEQKTINGYHVIYDSRDCDDHGKAKELLTQGKAKIILGAGNEDCLSTINEISQGNSHLQISLFSEVAAKDSNPWLIVLPKSAYPQKKVVEKLEKSPNYKKLSVDYRTAHAYDATTTFLKALEKSNFSLEQIMDKTHREALIKQIRENLLKFKVISVSVAPLRQLGPNQQNPAKNKIETVLEKGERVIELDEQPLMYWKKVEVFSNPSQKGWIHKWLLAE